MRLCLTTAGLFLTGCSLLGCATAQGLPNRFDVVETTVPRIQSALGTRLLSAEELMQRYLARITAYDDAGPKLNAYITLNPLAIAQARALDELRFVPGFVPGPLHGVPVALKDIIDTGDMPTTGGAWALANSIPSDDAFITRKLREAGGVVIGKLTLTEFANFMTNGMPAGYSGFGNYGFNPYNPVVLPGGDGRPLLSPSGSSAGSGIAATANLAAVTIGTETSGSILSPANATGIVGIKPTVGLVSRDGIIPITADQDTAGPMTRTVTDAAIVLGVIAGHDPADPATAACLTPGNCFSDYTPFLNPAALAGARLAVPPFPANRATQMNAAIALMRAAGATVVQIPALTGVTAPGVLNYGQKRDVNAYLESLPKGFPIRSLADLIAYNNNPPPPLTTAQTQKYGQTSFVASNAIDISPGSAATATYQANLALGYSQSRGSINAVLNGADGVAGTTDDFDAIVYSGSGGAGIFARAGWPTVIVPLAFVQSDGMPIPTGISFAGRAFSEPRLIALSYAFEQINQGRLAPFSAPALPGDTLLRGDVNRDGVVNFADADLIRQRLGTNATGPYDRADITGDGRIDARDLRAHTPLCSQDNCGRSK